MESIARVPVDDTDVFRAALKTQESDLQQLFSAGWLKRFDSVLTGMLAPATASAGQAFVRNAAQHRLAAICIALRLHQKRHGQLPETLSELQALGVDPTQLTLPGNQVFGYTVQDEQATVWGFDLLEESIVPAEPPTIDPAEAHAGRKRLWIWNLR